MKKICKGDEVIVVAGKDKGKIGTVIEVVNPEHVVVSGVAIQRKHTKPNPAKNIVGGVLDKNAPIHVSNVAIYNQDTKKKDKVKIEIDSSGKKSRVFKSSGSPVSK